MRRGALPKSRRLRAAAGVALVAAVALVGIVANFGLLRLTQDSADPVGRLRPRVTVVPGATTSPGTTTVDHDDGATEGRDRDD
jgi:hypothetical protein